MGEVVVGGLRAQVPTEGQEQLQSTEEGGGSGGIEEMQHYCYMGDKGKLVIMWQSGFGQQALEIRVLRVADEVSDTTQRNPCLISKVRRSEAGLSFASELNPSMLTSDNGHSSKLASDIGHMSVSTTPKQRGSKRLRGQ